jgi:hypothetical protein
MKSLEERLVEMITALDNNTQALKTYHDLMAKVERKPIIGADQAVIDSAKKAAAENEAKAKAAEQKHKEADAARATPEAKPLNKDGEHPDYVPLKKLFLELVTKHGSKGREVALATIAPLTALNVVKAGEQTPGQYAELEAKLKAALAGEASLV